MCDFGISGYLVDSVAKTMDAGCKPYMAVSVLVWDEKRDQTHQFQAMHSTLKIINF